jgi:hypothetical protein
VTLAAGVIFLSDVRPRAERLLVAVAERRFGSTGAGVGTASAGVAAGAGFAVASAAGTAAGSEAASGCAGVCWTAAAAWGTAAFCSWLPPIARYAIPEATTTPMANANTGFIRILLNYKRFRTILGFSTYGTIHLDLMDLYESLRNLTAHSIK